MKNRILIALIDVWDWIKNGNGFLYIMVAIEALIILVNVVN